MDAKRRYCQAEYPRFWEVDRQVDIVVQDPETARVGIFLGICNRSSNLLLDREIEADIPAEDQEQRKGWNYQIFFFIINVRALGRKREDYPTYEWLYVELNKNEHNILTILTILENFKQP